MIDKSLLRTHMKRYKVLGLKRANPHISFLHIHLHMSLDTIADATTISRKTITRLLLGQLPTKPQIRLLQRACLTATIELEKLASYERTNREGMYYGQIIAHMVHLGRSLSRHQDKAGATRP